MENTANILNPNKRLIPSLLKVFAISQFHLFYFKEDEEEKSVKIIAIKCINFLKKTGLYLRHSTLEK